MAPVITGAEPRHVLAICSCRTFGFASTQSQLTKNPIRGNSRRESAARITLTQPPRVGRRSQDGSTRQFERAGSFFVRYGATAGSDFAQGFLSFEQNRSPCIVEAHILVEREVALTWQGNRRIWCMQCLNVLVAEFPTRRIIPEHRVIRSLPTIRNVSSL